MSVHAVSLNIEHWPQALYSSSHMLKVTVIMNDYMKRLFCLYHRVLTGTVYMQPQKVKHDFLADI